MRQYLWIVVLFLSAGMSAAVVYAAPAMYFTQSYITPGPPPDRVHSASLVETESGNLLATWYGGSREGAKDVAIYLSGYIASTGKWSEPRVVIDRQRVRHDLARYIKKLGNPVLGKDRQGRLWLFFVSVSVGGWSGASVNYVTSDTQGRTWDRVRRLVTSPFLNVSTLVRSPPVIYDNGDIGLPVYHEFLGKFAELLRLTPEGKVVAKSRITWGQQALQPSIVGTKDRKLLAFMRHAGTKPGKVLLSHSQDTGTSWGEITHTSLPNTDSSVAALRDDKGRLLMVFNDGTKARNMLSLAISNDDGESWQHLHTFEHSNDEKAEFSYPAFVQDSTSRYHLVYTWMRTHIKHIAFSEQWLQKKIQETGGPR